MEGLTENTALFKSLAFTFGLMLLLASELVPALNSFLELHELPSPEFRQELILLLLLDVAVTWIYSKFLRRIFAIKPTAEQIKAAGTVVVTRQQATTAAAIELALKKHQ
jgi:Na+-transporting methylmalonyl-CoA/oxaloacetate decarboxylase gamma subunit